MLYHIHNTTRTHVCISCAFARACSCLCACSHAYLCKCVCTCIDVCMYMCECMAVLMPCVRMVHVYKHMHAWHVNVILINSFGICFILVWDWGGGRSTIILKTFMIVRLRDHDQLSQHNYNQLLRPCSILPYSVPPTLPTQSMHVTLLVQ